MFPRIPVLVGLLVAFVLSSCSHSTATGPQVNAQYSSGGSGDGLSLKDPGAVAPGGSTYIAAMGGVSPYTFYIVSGSAQIDPTTGYFTAGLDQGSVVVGVRDSAGVAATETVSIGQGWGSSLAMNPASYTATVGEQVQLQATGGAPPYFFALVSGGGSVNNNVFSAPATPGTSTVIVIDSRGGSATETITIQAEQTFTLSPQTTTVTAGGIIDFVASGGVPPYTFASVIGNGTFSKARYTASYIAGPARISVTDSQGSVLFADITVNPNYTFNHQGANFPLIVDYFLAFSYDNSEGDDHPNFTFWGNGPISDAQDVGKNCNPLLGFCAYVVTLNNFSNSNFAYASYRGTIQMSGRGATAALSFCISPLDRSRVFIQWTQNTGFTANETFDLAGQELFHGKANVSAYTLIDIPSGAGGANVVFDGAYTTQIDCNDFAGSAQVGVGI
jgi:hypothetical protein